MGLFVFLEVEGPSVVMGACFKCFGSGGFSERFSCASVYSNCILPVIFFLLSVLFFFCIVGISSAMIFGSIGKIHSSYLSTAQVVSLKANLQLFSWKLKVLQ